MDLLGKLNKGLKFGGAQGGGTSVYHDNEGAILDAATKLLAKCQTGQALLDFARENGIVMHVMRTKQDFGFTPEKSTVYISTPGGQDMPAMRAVIHLAGALRQAEQERIPGLERPVPTKLPPRDQFVRTHVAKDRDTLLTQTAVVYELGDIYGISEIVDEFARMGYHSLYEAYKEDMKSQEA
ncbi:MAG: hypothetical protein H6865_07580 [Rhodospirillales bacterium]|nr:hypothetical protein [Alphaproteobacteria bacterium]MCB9987475.1 hypothetical protein [Rhodospirillales bacterium]USO07549.1 MAG: hypothetical protein H6866_09075 [Rhodospirillales bacterium]